MFFAKESFNNARSQYVSSYYELKEATIDSINDLLKHLESNNASVKCILLNVSKRDVSVYFASMSKETVNNREYAQKSINSLLSSTFVELFTDNDIAVPYYGMLAIRVGEDGKVVRGWKNGLPPMCSDIPTKYDIKRYLFQNY